MPEKDRHQPPTTPECFLICLSARSSQRNKRWVGHPVLNALYPVWDNRFLGLRLSVGQRGSLVRSLAARAESDDEPPIYNSNTYRVALCFVWRSDPGCDPLVRVPLFATRSRVL